MKILESKRFTLETETETTKSTTAKLFKKISSLDVKICTIEGEKHRLEMALANKDSELVLNKNHTEKYMKKLEADREKIFQLESTIDSLEQKIENLESKNMASDADNIRLQFSSAEKSSQNDALNRKVEDFETLLRKQRQELQLSNDKFKYLETSNRNIKMKCQKLTQKIEKKKEECLILKEKYEKTVKKLKIQDLKNKENSTTIDNLNTKLNHVATHTTKILVSQLTVPVRHFLVFSIF